MTCPHCNQPLDNGAAFCGNCGQAIATVKPPTSARIPIVPIGSGVGAPAMQPIPATDNKRQATTALILGLISLITAFIPLIGVPVTIVGFIKAIKGINSSRRSSAWLGLFLLSLSLPVIIASGLYIYTHNYIIHSQPEVITTICYEATFDSSYVSTSDNTKCASKVISVKNGDDYTIKALTTPITVISIDDFTTDAKLDLANIIKNLPGAQINDQGVTTFKGEHAYRATITYQNQHSVVYYIMHWSSYNIGDKQANIFIVVHESTKITPTDLASLESSWTWNIINL